MNDIFRNVDQFDNTHARRMLIAYLKGTVAVQLSESPKQTTDIAYQIAGLMATDFVRSLDPTDPLDAVFTIAGELEVDPPEASELRAELIAKIKALDD